jgi:hypothetical protein
MPAAIGLAAAVRAGGFAAGGGPGDRASRGKPAAHGHRQADRVASFATPLSDALAGSGYLLTGDAGVVQLDVRVFYKVTEPYAFVLQGGMCCRRWIGW